jgi:RNA polymerase sigma factor (sigma-70 family)
VTPGACTEGLLRELAPQALGVVVRRYRDFDDAEDAVQEALVAAAATWPFDGQPDNPLGWLVRVASRRMVDGYRRQDARRRREDLAASWSRAGPEPASGQDDSLILLFMCCHPSLAPASAIALTLRAVGGLTTREIATAFLVPEATMAQRISRAKVKVKASHEPFTLPSPDQRAARLRSVLHVLYLLFNEGYATSSGPDLARTDLSGEAIRLVRGLRRALPEDPEVVGLLALMLLTDARRPARTGADGELVPLAEQDRTRWDRRLVSEGVALITEALRRGEVGEYQVQAAIAAAGATRARVVLRYGPEDVALVISDDGHGAGPSSGQDFDQDRGDPGHGLVGMRERVALFGGELTVGDHEGGGFRVEARLPLQGSSR